MPSSTTTNLTTKLIDLIITTWVPQPNVSSDDREMRSLLLVQLAKHVLGNFNLIENLTPSQSAQLVKHLPFLVSKCFVYPSSVSSSPISSSSSSSTLTAANAKLEKIEAMASPQQQPVSAKVLLSTTPLSIKDRDYNATCETYRNLVKSLFVLALRRSISFKSLSQVEVRKSIVELLLACQVFDDHSVQPHQVLGAQIAVTGFKMVRLVVSTSIQNNMNNNNNNNNNNMFENNNNTSSSQQQQQPQQQKTSGLPPNLISALTNSLKQVPMKLKSLADSRKHRKRGFFEGKDEQERNLQLVAALRTSILNILQLLFEDGVSPASTYSIPIVRELGYKRRDFEVSSVAAFVSFSSEFSAMEPNLRGIASLITSKMVSTSQQLTKTSLKNSYINGDLRNALLDDDISMQLALLELVFRRVAHIGSNLSSFTTTMSSNNNNNNNNNNNRNESHYDDESKNEFKLLSNILIPLLNCSPDVIVSACACCLLSQVILLFNKSEQLRLFKPASEDEATPQFVVSSLLSIRETLRSISLRATGSLELDCVSQSLASLSKITSSNNNGSFSYSPKNKLNEILLGTSSMSTSTTNNRLISQCGYYFHHHQQQQQYHNLASSSCYPLRIRRLGFILSARLFELLSMNRLLQLRQEEDGDDDLQLQDEKDQQMNEFLEWMSQCGLRFCDNNSNNNLDSNIIHDNNQLTDSSSSSSVVAIDALYGALRFVKDEIEFEKDRKSSLHKMDDFKQLCCDFELRLMK